MRGKAMELPLNYRGFLLLAQIVPKKIYQRNIEEDE
jgi:hypothetical protein